MIYSLSLSKRVRMWIPSIMHSFSLGTVALPIYSFNLSYYEWPYVYTPYRLCYVHWASLANTSIKSSFLWYLQQILQAFVSCKPNCPLLHSYAAHPVYILYNSYDFKCIIQDIQVNSVLPGPLRGSFLAVKSCFEKNQCWALSWRREKGRVFVRLVNA